MKANADKIMTKKLSQIHLGLWGAKSSGKTTYLTMLYHYLQKEQDNNWNVKVDEIFLPQVLDNLARIQNEGKFPRADIDSSGDQISTLKYTLTRLGFYGLRKAEVQLSFMNAPGHFYEQFLGNTPIFDTVTRKTHLNPVDYLISCQGLIILLDRQQETQPYRKLLTDLLTACQLHWQQQSKNKKLPHYLAFCLAKADQENLWNNEKPQKDPSILAKEIMGENLWGLLKSSYYFDLMHSNDPKRNRCKFYFLSSIGRYYEEGQYREATYINLDTDSESETANTEKQNPPEIVNKTDHSDWFASSNSEGSFSREEQSSIRIKQEVALEPLNILAPIEWMIQSMQMAPPFHLSPSSSP
jgi:hypothetical protein